MSIVYRPRSLKKRANSKDEFELCYLRHKYFRKTLYNPTAKEMAAYERIVRNLSTKTYYVYRNLLAVIGFDLEDIENIGKIHLVSFLGLFSLESDQGAYSDFLSAYKKACGTAPDPIDLLNKNRANFTLFLKQRMEDLIRVCRQKAPNVHGSPTDTMQFFCGRRRPPADSQLLANPAKYGYKRVDLGVFRTAKKKSKKFANMRFTFDYKWWVAVPVEPRRLDIIDFSGAGLDPYDSIHNMNPEQILFHKEQESLWEQKVEDFKNKPNDDKARTLANFVKKNIDNPAYKDEIKIAERYLKKLGVDLE